MYIFQFLFKEKIVFQKSSGGMNMIIDAHCDVLYKIWGDSSISFEDSDQLRVNYQKWKNSHVKIQCFAIFVPEDVPLNQQFDEALKMVDIFYDEIINKYDDIKLITSKDDITALKPHEKGAVLTLEGCHPIGEDITKLKTLLRLGVKAVGLTWNQANAVCDGIREKRGAGLSGFGEEVIELLNRENIWVDFSHISYKGFWDVLKIAKHPMASHSNVYELAKHPRNLDREQIQALIKRDAFIGITYVPEFLTGTTGASFRDVIKHIKGVVELGGEDCVGLGSDFDGTSGIVTGLYDYTEYNSFIDQLEEAFPVKLVNKISWENFYHKFPS